MSPIIDLQLRLRQLGTLRMGELTTKGGKTYPSSRDTWRITTSDPKIAAQVAERFGGTPTEWDSRSSESLVVDTDQDALPIAVVPGHALSQYFELWSGGGCVRRCDGHDEMLSDGPCLCDPDARECKPTTRLSVVVRGIDALGLFRLNTTGYYAAVELGGAVQFLEARTAKGEQLEGWLRIEGRKIIRDGKTKLFKVPVLDVAYGIDRMLPKPTANGLPDGYKPMPALIEASVSLEQGLEIAHTQEVTRKPKGRAPIPQLDDDIPFGEPVTVDESPRSQILDLEGKDRKTALNDLFNELRREGHVTAEQMFTAVARLRELKPPDGHDEAAVLADLIDGRKLDGKMSFAKLRDQLTPDEMSNLIKRLGTLADNVKAAAEHEGGA